MISDGSAFASFSRSGTITLSTERVGGWLTPQLYGVPFFPVDLDPLPLPFALEPLLFQLAPLPPLSPALALCSCLSGLPGLVALRWSSLDILGIRGTLWRQSLAGGLAPSLLAQTPILVLHASG